MNKKSLKIFENELVQITYSRSSTTLFLYGKYIVIGNDILVDDNLLLNSNCIVCIRKVDPSVVNQYYNERNVPWYFDV